MYFSYEYLQVAHISVAKLCAKGHGTVKMKLSVK
jgi:hypothetical protein